MTSSNPTVRQVQQEKKVINWNSPKPIAPGMLQGGVARFHFTMCSADIYVIS